MAKVAKPQEFPNPATMCYKRPVMEQAPATAAGRTRASWTLAPALLAAITTLALIGCPTATPTRVPAFRMRQVS